MTDDAFHLTPHDVRAQEFSRAMRGYDRLQVEEFRARVADELEALLRERAAAEERQRNAQEQLRAFRERERAMNDALVSAQQLRADTAASAQREADAILREAKHEARRIVEDAEAEVRRIREKGEIAARQFAAYTAGFRALLERQKAELDVLESHAREIVKVQAEAMATERSEG